MYTRRRAAVLVAGGLSVLLLGAVAAGPASAHGAMSNPVSRTFGCGTEGGSWADSAACRAALAASGRQSFSDWDTERVPGIAGRDKQLIPDGKLCSGGLPQFRGLDLPRGDWPTTRLPSGVAFQFSYRTTIAHTGTFRLYVTRDGYRPTAPLTWAMLEPAPFASVTDPRVAGGAYRFTATLPRKSGRHVIYTVWQNSSTSDTYYTCSDVVFPAAKPATGGTTATPPATPPRTTTPARATTSPAAPSRPAGPSTTAATSTEPAPQPGAQPPVTGTDLVASAGPDHTPLILIVAAAVALAGALAVLLLVVRRRRA
ncbi:MAG: hypothetical protein V7637_3702 [Mycobacteriales bacterium]